MRGGTHGIHPSEAELAGADTHKVILDLEGNWLFHLKAESMPFAKWVGQDRELDEMFTMVADNGACDRPLWSR